MSFNIWNGGLSGGYPIEQTAKAILASGADVVGLQGKCREDMRLRQICSSHDIVVVIFTITNASTLTFEIIECSTTSVNYGGKYMLPELIKHLPGWYYSDQKLCEPSRNPWGVVSKFPIVNTTELGFGVKIQLNNHRHPELEPSYIGLPESQYHPTMRPRTRSSSFYVNDNTRFMYLFNCHLFYFPYQPFQLLKIPYGDQPFLSTAEEAIESCRGARGKEMETILGEIRKVAELEKDVPIFLTGDFNEPSHLDWTPLSVLAGLQPLTVEWPMTEMAYKAGLVDLWRAYRPHTSGTGSLPTSPNGYLNGCFNAQSNDINGINNSLTSSTKVDDPISEREKAERAVIERPGMTWSVLSSEMDETDHYDRIDFIFGLDRESSPIALKEIAVKFGEEFSRSGEKNDRVFKPWPSDHRAVIATVLM
jgi:hypothetical protein